jgi:RHS repeat-associated protein
LANDPLESPYDYAGNRTVRDNRNATADSTRKIDQRYVYDGLLRLQDMEQGLFFTYGSLTNPTAFQSWTLDALGNWGEFDDDANGDSTWDLQQKRYHNQANEIDGNGGNSITLQSGGAGANWADPAHDLAGNMTSIPKPSSLTNSLTLKYDAWNRLVSVIDPAVHASNPIAKFQYDALGRRIVKTLDANGDTSPNEIRHFYYNEQWQVLEERLEVSGTIDPDPINQYVWNPEYVDSLAMRRYDADTNPGTTNSDYYYLQDANYNVTAIVNDTGAVVERYAYTPYGKPTILNGANGTDLDASVTEWAPDSNQTASDVGNVYLFTGREYDWETGIQFNRRRPFLPPLGRWLTRDPIRYVGDANLYAYVGSMPTYYVDPLGLYPNIPPHWPLPGTKPSFPDHLNRNKNNQCPKNRPGGSGAIPGELYADGAKCSWRFEGSNPFHGGAECYRGTGVCQHFQCCYDDDDKLITKGPDQGTYDYSPPYGPDGQGSPCDIPNLLGHLLYDLLPHFIDNNYGPTPSQNVYPNPPYNDPYPPEYYNYTPPTVGDFFDNLPVMR